MNKKNTTVSPEAMEQRKRLAGLIRARMAKPATAAEEKLWHELMGEMERNPNAGAEEAWAGEMNERIERLRDGSAHTVTADEALSSARARLTRRRA
jgi:hypothetical protein